MPEDAPARRRPWRLLTALAAALGVVVALVWAGQRSLIYLPDTSAPPAAADVGSGWEDVELSTADGLELTAWLVPPSSDTREQAVLVAPGNGGNRAARAGLARDLAARGFTVLLLDYRGYGGNPGRPSETGLRHDARAAQDALSERGFAAEDTFYLGESLGSAVVVSLAAERPPAGMLLRSPFTSLADVGRHHYRVPVAWLLRDEFPLAEQLAGVDVPVTVVHGTADRVVPAEQSETVAGIAPRLSEHLVLEGADHNDPVMFGPEVADALARLADG